MAMDCMFMWNCYVIPCTQSLVMFALWFSHCAEVVVLKYGTLVYYETPVKRFLLHDDWILGKVRSSTVASSSFADDAAVDTDANPGENHCGNCSTSMYHKYLFDLKTLSVDHEWMCHVPLIMQIIVEAVINLESVKRAVSPLDYATSKIQRLYTAFDNRCYFGMIRRCHQEKNFQSAITV